MNNNSALVDIFRALKNPQRFGLLLGEVKADFPDIEIDIGNGITLDKDDLVFSASMLKDYAREYSIESTDTKLRGSKLDSNGTDFSLAGAPLFTDANGTLGSVPVLTIPTVATSWSTTATNFDQESDDFTSTGTITLTDEIVTGDKVMIMATESNQLFYVIDKVVSF